MLYTRGMSTSPLPIGPYFDYIAISDYLRERSSSFANLCARAVLAGDLDSARYYAEHFAPFDAARDRVNAYFDAHHDKPERFIGWDVQRGFESRTDPVEDPWATPITSARVQTPAGVVELGPEDFGSDFDAATEGPALDPELPTRCDSEKGWAECGCGIIWHFKSHCSLPLELWSGNGCDPAAGTHDIAYVELLEDCHCGSFDPAIDHPCIGHDRVTQLPLEGPSMFWKYWEIRQGLRRG